uniref:ATP synthase F0 subunit 8 n=1 Tax=Plexippus paykulli TaxID=243411 RepID=A0A0U1X9Q2_PLEPA|nr:ATP synthase F0 subunit 8 [Plexippus paykulli]AIM52642.1 ATP synthase F0 subunit 8 [Plexippus paykulli]
MPQLMPLMWMSSVVMSMVILLMLIDMFFYKENYSLVEINYIISNSETKFKW